jgi:hypothetical protein
MMLAFIIEAVVLCAAFTVSCMALVGMLIGLPGCLIAGLTAMVLG